MFYQTNHIGTSDYFLKEYGTNLNFPPHLHHCFELVTVLSGEMFITVNGTEYLITPGDALLIFPNQIHAFRSSVSEHLLCIFSPKLVSAYSSKITGLAPKSNFFVPNGYLIEQLDSLKESDKSILKKGLLYMLCSEFDKTAEYTDHSTDRKNLLETVFLFIEQSFKGECTLESLSKSTGYTYSYLSRYFKNAVGISFSEYVNLYRLNNICHLLNNSNEAILNCAYESGYTSLRSFNRNFKKHFGSTPSAYIKSQKVRKEN